MVQETSLLAYIELDVSLGERQYAVLNIIRDHGPVTNTEISKHLCLPINSITPRVHELRKAGKVVCAGKRQCTITGRHVLVWEEVKKRW